MDDDPTSSALLECMLETGGFEVLTAQDGASGRRIAAQAKPDVVIMDINLPDENGIEACGKLKRDPITRSIPVIFISVVQDVSAKVAGLRAGGCDYITKPYEPDEVLARVRLQTDLRQSEQIVALQAAALDEARELIAIVDTDCKILAINKSCETASGCSKEALVGRDLCALTDYKTYPEAYLPLVDGIKSARFWNGELNLKFPGGSTFVFDVSATPFPDPSLGRSFVVLVARDITDREWTRASWSARRATTS